MKRKKLWMIISCLMLFSVFMFFSIKPSTAQTASTGKNWWDKFGEPKYGGTLVFQSLELASTNFDPAEMMMHAPFGYFLECLFGYNWTIDRNTWSYSTGFTPEEYWVPWLAESWEWTDPVSLTVHLRKGIHWQNKPPVNGREFTAEDVQYTFDRLLGTGSGFTKPNPFWMGPIGNMKQVIAKDKYTVVFIMKKPSAVNIYQIFQGENMATVVPREWIEQGDLSNWKTLAGTGPWIITGFTKNASLTGKRNPDYWGYDERHPQNKLPYIDEIKEVAIPDSATALAAVRTGKIDMVPGGGARFGCVSMQQAITLAKTNPEIKQGLIPANGYDLELRCDTKPFNDIRVRKALQMSINRPTIAKVYYQGSVDGIPCGVASPIGFRDWITPYDKWPKDLKDEYSYNPAKAKKLLADAGYPNGFKTSIIASTNSDLQLLQLIKSQLKDIGVDMTIRTMDEPSYRAFGAAMKHDQMGLNVNAGMFFQPGDIIRWRHSKNTRDNWTANNDPKYDAMIDAFNNTTETAKAKKIFNEADQYLLKQHWAVPVFPIATPILWQPYVMGYSGEFHQSGSERGYWGARVWIDQKLKKSMGR